MWDLFFELLSWVFGRSGSKSSSIEVRHNIPSTPKRSSNEKISLKALQHYNSAEQNRKAGHVKKAEKHYWESIKRWKKYEGNPAPAPFRELAKLYYHTGFTEKAVEVLDLYGVEDEKAELLKERFEKGKFRRLENKYDEKPTGDYP